MVLHRELRGRISCNLSQISLFIHPASGLCPASAHHRRRVRPHSVRSSRGLARACLGTSFAHVICDSVPHSVSTAFHWVSARQHACVGLSLHDWARPASWRMDGAQRTVEESGAARCFSEWTCHPYLTSSGAICRAQHTLLCASFALSDAEHRLRLANTERVKRVAQNGRGHTKPAIAAPIVHREALKHHLWLVSLVRRCSMQSWLCSERFKCPDFTRFVFATVTLSPA